MENLLVYPGKPNQSLINRVFVFVKTTLCLFALSSQMQGQVQTADSKSANNNLKMKEFSLLVRVPVTYTTEQAKAMNPKWNVLLDSWKAADVYIISFAFPGEGHVVSGADKSVKKEAVISDGLRVVSNLFVRAIDFEAAVNLAKAVPILEFGGTVEVREVPQRPDSISPKR